MASILCVTSFSYSEETSMVFSFREHGAWPPYIIEESLDTYTGVMLDIITAVAGKLDYKIKIMPMPEKRIRKYLLTGEIDVRPKAMEWVKNPKDYLWSKPVVESSDYLVFSTATGYQTIKDIAGTDICTHFGYGYPTLKKGFSDNVYGRSDSNSEASMIMKLLKGRCSAAIMNKNVALWWAAKEKGTSKKLRFSKDPIASAPYRFQFTKAGNKWKDKIESFDIELNKMKQDGTIDKIIKKYLGEK